MAQAGLVDSFIEEMTGLIVSFSSTDPAGKKAFDQMLVADAKAFRKAGIRVLSKSTDTAGARYLVHLLTKAKLLTDGLLDPAVCSLAEGAAAAKLAAGTGFPLQSALEGALSKGLSSPVSPEMTARILRSLDLLDATAAQAAWSALQTELMACPDPIIRSRAVLLIGRSLRNAAWIGRRLLDKDVRVQANAVQALWTYDADVAVPLMRASLKSRNNRVAGNAAVGLYRFGDLPVVPELFKMAQHRDPLFRLSAYWAIGETEDARFLPFLLEQFKATQGRIHLAVTRAMSRIRHRAQASLAAGALEIRPAAISLQNDGSRRMTFGMSGESKDFSSGWKPFDFAIWEDGTLVEDFQVKPPANPPVLVVGFVAPRFVSTNDPFANAVAQCLSDCLAMKRRDDLWRIDRFGSESRLPAPATSNEESNLPYDSELISQDLKMRHGFHADAEWLTQAVAKPVPRDRAAADVLAAVTRQCDAMSKHAGKRHMFLFVDQDSATALEDESNATLLRDLIQHENIALHGICPDSTVACAELRKLCRTIPDSSFTDAPTDLLATAVRQAYDCMLNQFEISYGMPAGQALGSLVTLKVSGSHGAGQAEFPLRRPEPPSEA